MTENGAIVAELAGRLGEGAREVLDVLPPAEVRYLASRPELVRRYGDPARGRFLLTWEMSAVARGEEALGEIERACPVAWRGARALDVGCGDGGFLVAFARRGALANGIDLGHANAGAALRRARAWEVPASPVCGSALDLPYPSASFAAVTCGDVIEHLPDSRRALGEIARVLAPGGVLWLAAPTRFNLKHAWADPHFGCFGVALLPRTAAAWVLARVARRLASPAEYDVETLPSFHSLERELEAAGLEVIAGLGAHQRDARTLRTPWKRAVVRFSQRVVPRFVALPLARCHAELFSPFRVVCRKGP